MSSRGHFIGEIVDELAFIRARIEDRGRLNLFDLHQHIENFYKELLNITFDYNLNNLNKSRMNEPGVDLADIGNTIAFQITAQNSSVKINETLEKVEKHHKEKFNRVVVMIVGKKQGSYSIKNNSSLVFSENDIWDTNDLLKNIVILEIDKLQQIYKFVKDESVRVRIELEIPDTDGNFKTSIADIIEKVPKPQIGSMANLQKFFKEEGYPLEKGEKEEYIKCFEEISKKLSSLPRITREVFAELFDHIEDRDKRDTGLRVNYDKFERRFRGFNLKGELNILKHDEMIDIDPPDGERQVSLIIVEDRFDKDNFLDSLYRMSLKNKINFKKAVKTLDFSDF